MTRRLLKTAIAITVASSACAARPMRVASVTPLFGPVVSSETISGHVLDEGGGVLLLVAGRAVVRIDPDARTQARTTIQIPVAARCWGLARLADGSLWTLLGRNAVIEIGPDGRIARELALPVPHLGLFGVADRLIFQRGIVPAGTPALFAGSPKDDERLPWSALMTRPFESLAAGAAAALNLVGCGMSRGSEMPCWFPGEPELALITANGSTRRVTLRGLPPVAPEKLINAAVPKRPIRDVYVERDGTMWVISTGQAPEGAKDLPGGWLLARYGPRGEPIDIRQLSQPARIILRAGGGRALVLTGSGMVAEVIP